MLLHREIPEGLTPQGIIDFLKQMVRQLKVTTAHASRKYDILAKAGRDMEDELLKAQTEVRSPTCWHTITIASHAHAALPPARAQVEETKKSLVYTREEYRRIQEEAESYKKLVKSLQVRTPLSARARPRVLTRVPRRSARSLWRPSCSPSRRAKSSAWRSPRARPPRAR